MLSYFLFWLALLPSHPPMLPSGHSHWRGGRSPSPMGQMRGAAWVKNLSLGEKPEGKNGPKEGKPFCSARSRHNATFAGSTAQPFLLVYLTVSGRTARLCRTHPSRPRRGSGTLLVWGRLTLKRFFWPALLHQNGAQRASAPAPSLDHWPCSCPPLCRSFHSRSWAPRPCGFTAAH